MADDEVKPGGSAGPANSQELKTRRGHMKGALTRAMNDIERCVAEEEVDEVVRRLSDMKMKFRRFEAVHDEYFASLDDEGDIDNAATYYYEAQNIYVEQVKTIKAWLRTLNVKTMNYTQQQQQVDNASVQPVNIAIPQQPETSRKPRLPQEANSSDDDSIASSAGDLIRREIINMVNLPKVELEPFDGEPLNFHSFIATFNENVHNVVSDGRMRLTRLLQYTCGKAKDAIRSCALIGGEAGYMQARKILSNRFGDDHIIAEHIIRSLKGGKVIKLPADMRIFADELLMGHATLENMGKLYQIDNQSCIIEIADRLQSYVRNRWKKIAMDVKRETKDYPKFKQFVEFIAQQAEEVSDPVYGSWNTSNSKFTSDGKKSTTSFSASVRRDQFKVRTCALCNENHRLFWCAQFKSMKPIERLKFVREKKLCENCLFSNHSAKDCRKASVCTVPGCGLKHTKFIHVDNIRDKSNSQGLIQDANVNNVDADKLGRKVCIPIVPVNVENKCHTFALLDTGSNTTFCTRKLVNLLGIKGSSSMYTLNTISESKVVKQSEIVNLVLKSANGEDELKLRNVYVVDKIPVVNPEMVVADYAHLADLSIVANGEVTLLIGQDHAEALIPLEVRKGKVGDPFAVRTLFGWSINGPLCSNDKVSKHVVSHFVTSNQGETCVPNTWNDEAIGVSSDKLGWSVEDKKVFKLWNESVKIVSNHYQLPIPFRDNINITSNISQAMSRLEGLRKTLERKKLYDKYDKEIQKLLCKGYAESVPVYDVNCSDVWYLPHHGVTSVNKPGKIRVVYDCAAKFRGYSLNDVCLKGPDLINNLQHVLLRFRNHKYAISADVEAMYYQVLVPQSQRDYLRFLWFNEYGEIEHYRMAVHVFGGVWSSSAASYALTRTVRDFEASELVRNVIEDAFYVDDCLVSVTSIDEAEEIIHGVKQVLSLGGFNLTKFVVNDESMISKIPEVDRAIEVKDLSSSMNSKVLGVKWNVKSDFLYFDVDLGEKLDVTRRIMLSTVSSLYDPLGLISPVLIPGKVLFQDATRMKLTWDDPVPIQVLDSWSKWLRSLRGLENLVIPRCVIPDSFADSYLELHHFSDASSQAYGCCSYIRCVSRNGSIHIALIYAKGRVAPLNSLSIPRLELQGAVMAARVDAMLREELKLQLGKSTFWVDSEIILKYIANESRRFQVFVANRIGEIRSLTEPHQWRHVGGDINPADIVSRGIDSSQLLNSSWLVGPDFLHCHRDSWLADKHLGELSNDDPEVKKVKVVPRDGRTISFNAVKCPEIHPLDVLTDHFSDFYRLKRALCWLIRFREKLRGKEVIKGTLTLSEFKHAEIVLVKHVQSQYFHDEISTISVGKPVGKSSPIRDLLPILSEDGLLRVGGRIKNASIEFDNRYPIILSHRCRIASLIARETHEVAHLGVEWDLSRLRCKFWITKARLLLKGIKGKCVICRKLWDLPCSQKMADLPSERLLHGYPPFSMVGTDCFGPIMVKRGRAQVKRYGCLFTCFSTRAVHVEILESMDTDSLVNALRRFMSRRGTPLKIFSDLGSNYVGCKNELFKALKELNKSKLHEYCVKQSIEWVFNPPCAPHMGGVFERMVQTVKRVLNAVLGSARLTDEILSTVMCEVENLVNSRPITMVSEDGSDPSALSPNHLLLLRGGSSPVPGKFCVSDIYRRRWRHVQHLVDVFWSRWLKEYLPQLQKTSKWHDVKRNLKVNDVVLIVEENTPRGLWPMGIVTQLKTSTDGLVRTVHVKTGSTELVRPITKIVFIEGEI